MIPKRHPYGANRCVTKRYSSAGFLRRQVREAAAFIVCHGIGLDANTSSSDYIQLHNGDRKTLMESLESIQRTASEILEAVTSGDDSRCEVVVRELCVSAAA